MAPRGPGDPLFPANVLKKPRHNSSRSSQMLCEWEQIEENWCNKKCESVSHALIKTEHPKPSTSGPEAFDLMIDNQIEYEHQHLIEDDDDDDPPSDINESDTESDDSQQSIASNPGPGVIVTAATGDMNQRRRIREERQWHEVIAPMFKFFMLCKKVTFNWSRVDWDLDKKAQCRCSAAKKRIRNVGLVDILTHTIQPVVFCPCQPDQVRLILMGYVGGSPVQPEIAFSLRFLRLHDLVWKYCCVRTHPLAQAFDDFHRPAREFKQDVTNEPTTWGRRLSCAVDAYRRLNQLEQDLQFRAMNLLKKETLGANCPRCFGANEYSKEENEPDYVVCIDGNFQQRRHKSASVEVSEIPIRYPNLFLHANEVEKWEKVQYGSLNEPPDPCTQMHTAANDTRSASTWRACDDTGLLAMVCRHDHVLAFVNIVQSGEKSFFAHALMDWLINQLDESDSKVGFLYDIGCNLEKGLIKVEHLDSYFIVPMIVSTTDSPFHYFIFDSATYLKRREPIVGSSLVQACFMLMYTVGVAK
ncbi:hypothetical protein DFH28DRAFT_906578 [Melampsora americana]|nr:hypothetical protein DFH28DRAFT_906578 [Melampsora americana]